MLAVAAMAPGAGAALPVKGSFVNVSASNGVRLETTKHTVRSTFFFCKNTRYQLIRGVHVRHDGTFSFRGKMDRYGPSGQPWGKRKVRFKGRFTKRNRVQVKRTLSGCGTATVRATGAKG